MTARLAAWSTAHPRTVLAAALLAVLAAEVGRRGLRRDVLPDLSDPQIVLVADWMGHSATDVAGSVTAVLTRALDGVPGATAVRGASMPGMAYVDVVFGSAGALAAGRRAIVERVAAATPRLPPGATVQIGPEASSTGWVFQYVLVDPASGYKGRLLRGLQDERVRPALAAIPGVAEVASVGGLVQDALVEVLADRVRARGLAFSDVAAALAPFAGAHAAASLDELAALPVPAPVRGAGDGAAAPAVVAPRVGDLARVRLLETMPDGLADLGGAFPAVGGIVVARRDADLRAVIERVRKTIADLQPGLPSGVRIVTVYDRLELADRVQRTLAVALGEEIVVVGLVILLFLLHPRSALVPLATLPLVVLLTLGAMRLLGVPATIMSLSGIGIALGMAVDADVVALEACHRHLETLDAGASPADVRARLVAASGTFGPAILTSLLIAALAFLPVLGFSGETGRLLRPLALSKTLVIAAAALVTLTVAPALRALTLGGRRRPPAELANPLTRKLVRAYRPFVQFALKRPVFTLVTAGLAVLSCLPLVGRLGGEFLPRIDEGDLLFMPTTLAGVPMHLAEIEMRREDRLLAKHGEVGTVFGKVGRADTATDRAPFSMMETTIRLLPRDRWPKVARLRWYSRWAPAPLRRALGLVWPEESPLSTTELIESLDRATRLPGWSSAWTSPIRARMDMMSTGVNTPVGIRVVAPSPGRLEALAAALRDLARRQPGTRSAVAESLGGEARLELALDPAALARFEVDPAVARATADLVISEGQIGTLTLDGKRLRLRITPELNMRGPADVLRAATVRSSRAGASQPVPLGLLGRAEFQQRPAMVHVVRGELVSYVYVDLAAGTDVLHWVRQARAALDAELAARRILLRPDERIEWTGQYELLAEGQRRLGWIIPAVALCMLGLLYLQFRSLAEALIVLASVPFALVGSFWTLYLCGYAWSAPVWVGLLSVVGLAMQTGVVMVVYIDAAFYRRVRDGQLESREDIVAAHAEGTIQRLRPKIMTIATMAAGLVPLVWAEGAGSEIIRRIAAPMIGGLGTSAFLTLEVLPVVYTLWRHRQLRRAQRAGVPIQQLLGTIPPWAR